jgi:hypothetical protein
MDHPFVPADFEVPGSFEGPGFRLEPLGPEHNERDHAAWMSSIDHIRSTPGFESQEWPTPMDLEANRTDLVGHARDFTDRVGFTYSVLDGDDVIGCLYIYPARTPGHDAEVRSWVTEGRAEMDTVVWRSVTRWIEAEWPFSRPCYASRS